MGAKTTSSSRLNGILSTPSCSPMPRRVLSAASKSEGCMVNSGNSPARPSPSTIRARASVSPQWSVSMAWKVSP